jgi:hypothetical protein
LKRLQAWRDAQEAKVRVLKDNLDKMRIDLQISEYVADEGGPTPILEPETVRKIDSERIIAMAEYSRTMALTDRLGKMGRQELLKALPIACPGDQVLSDLLQKRNAAEQELAQLVQSRGEDHPDVKRTMALLKKIDEQLDQTAAGIMEGLNVHASSYKAQVDQLEKALEQAKNADVKNANKFAPYFPKKRELLAQQKLLDQLETRVVQERIETTLRGPESKSPAGQTTEISMEPVDMNNVTVTCKLPLRNMRLVDVLDAITKLASAPIEYTVEEYGVIFTPRTQREVAAK